MGRLRMGRMRFCRRVCVLVCSLIIGGVLEVLGVCKYLYRRAYSVLIIYILISNGKRY